MKEYLKKFKVILIGSMILLLFVFVLLGYLLFFANKTKIKEYSNSVYSIKYDSTWNLKEKKKNYVLLKHGSKSNVEIYVKTLDEETRYNDISTFIDDIEQTIKVENKSFHLIHRKQVKVTKKELEGYKLLYEDQNSQAMVVVSKYNDKLFTFVYKTDNTDFDILLDSVENMIYNFAILDDAVDVQEKLDEIKTTGITYSTKKFNLSKKKTQRTIANDNYEIQYKLSEDIPRDDFDSAYYYGTYKDTNSNDVRLSIMLSPLNIYEYITNNLMSKEKNYKRIDDYDHIKVEIDKHNEGYIYKISYDFKTTKINESGDFEDCALRKEEYYVVYEIDPITTLVYELEADEKNISEQWINNLEIVSKKKYGAYITRNIENHKIINEMKTLKSDSHNKQYYSVTLYTPEEYFERYYDNNNIYETRYFGKDYDKKSEEYNTTAKYILDSTSTKIHIKTAQSMLSSYKNNHFQFVKDLKIGKNTYKYYTASYTSGSVKYNKAYLFLDLLDENYNNNSFCLEISTKNDIIKEDMIGDLLNIDIKVKDYKN